MVPQTHTVSIYVTWAQPAYLETPYQTIADSKLMSKLRAMEHLPSGRQEKELLGIAETFNVYLQADEMAAEGVHLLNRDERIDADDLLVNGLTLSPLDLPRLNFSAIFQVLFKDEGNIDLAMTRQAIEKSLHIELADRPEVSLIDVATKVDIDVFSYARD